MVSLLYQVSYFSGYLIKGQMEVTLLTPIGEEMKPWEVIGTAIIATTAVQVTTAWGREDGPQIYAKARVEGEGLHYQEVLSSMHE